MTKLAEIEAAALRLPDRDRRHLADILIGTLPPPPNRRRAGRNSSRSDPP